ncbi:MAG: dihydrodipicolinate synthase family protein [Halobacteriales archaeon]|nr:dihydrodipicolinate synthase family protein [Halobacteriales archaeon]
MHGTGVALVTPFTEHGDIDEAALASLVPELEHRGVDFIVPVGSTGESVLMTPEEQGRVIEVVADAASVPVLAGTGQPGLRATEQATVRAAAAGADAAMVVTPYYYRHDQDALAAYYRELADGSDLPIYAYSVPGKTGVAIEPETAAEIAEHPNVAGLKDSSGDLERLHRELSMTREAAFDVLIGHGGLLAQALEAGASGGILALANVAPERASEVYERYAAGEEAEARSLNAELVELNRAITARYGVPGVKAAMRLRGLPAGHVRKPHRPVGPAAEAELERLVEAAEP